MQRLAENVAPKTMSEFEAATTEENRINTWRAGAERGSCEGRACGQDATREQQAQAARELNETRIEVARIAASARRGSGEGGSDKYKTTTDVGDQGQRLVQSNGVYHQVLGDGTIDRSLTAA
jgi:DNA invertase Pin-like site-specific DNA recombinase